MTCNTCNYQYIPARSKRVQSCPNCLHKDKKGEYLTDAKRRKALESLEKSRQKAAEKQALKPKIAYKIPTFSEKGKVQSAKVEAEKRKLKQAAKDGEHTQCEGCGKFVKQIDGSHKVPLSRSIELSAHPDNIRLLCRECHTTWENFLLPGVLDLSCFIQDIKYLYRVDNPRFWRMFQKIIDHHDKSQTDKTERVISKIERFT